MDGFNDSVFQMFNIWFYEVNNFQMLCFRYNVDKMGKPSNKARAKRHKLMEKMSKSGSNGGILKCVYWNANGLHCLCKQQELIDLMEQELLDVVMVDETHFKKNSNLDLSAFDVYSPICIERGFGDKQGGGKMVLFSKKFQTIKWLPSIDENEWVNNERVWILIQNSLCKVAICSVYMACESPINPGFKTWNDIIYSEIGKELKILEKDGYKCAIVGDLNAHVGVPPRGIEGNREGVNYNGKKLLNFIESNNLSMINKDKQLCSGTFTRITPHSSSILDYLLVSKNMGNDVIRMGIDTDVELLSGSDHVALRFDIKIAMPMENNRDECKGIFLSNRRDMGLAKTEMDMQLNAVNWDELSLNEWGETLQNILVSANINSYNTEPRKVKKPRNTFRLKRLKAKRKEMERKEKRLSLEKIKRAIANEDWTIQDQNELNTAAKESQAVLEEVQKKSFELKAKSRSLLRIRKDIKNELFWSLAQKTEKKKGGLSIIKGPDGKIETERNKVADMAITELAKVFMGKKSPIFESHGQQIIKEITVKSSTSFQKWVPKLKDEFEFEHEVCAPCTNDEVVKIIKNIKPNRAPGVDGVLTTMLKNASTNYVAKLTEMINICLKQGDIPAVLNTGKMTLIDKKEPSLEVSKKRPLTVSSVLLSVITKLLHARMNAICERENLYGIVQYGFRKQRSTTDCVFIIINAIKEARRKHKTISIAFCDIAKAYDSVCRELLYTKLRSIGFGGRVVSLIRSMYYNDSIRVSLANGLSEPLYFTQGVKQGCSLSPLLFAL